MNDQKIKTTYDHANELFEQAQEELARPEEDVVPYSVCRSAFKAVNIYLTAYLLKHGFDIHASMSLELILNKCRELDPKFNSLNLAPLYTTEKEQNVWMDMGTVREFISLATKTKNLVQ